MVLYHSNGIVTLTASSKPVISYEDETYLIPPSPFPADNHPACSLAVFPVFSQLPNGYAIDRAMVRQKKTGRPVKFEISDQTRQSIDDYISKKRKEAGDFLFTGYCSSGRNLSTRQYARLVSEWIALIGLDPSLFGTHSIRRTKATLIYRKTGNLRAVQLLLGHTKIESTVRYLGIEVDDALEIAEQVDV